MFTGRTLPDMDTLTIPAFSLGDRMAKARQHARLSRDDLAQILGCSLKTVGNYEGGHTQPRKPTIVQWALACGVPVDWLRLGDAWAPDPDDGSVVDLRTQGDAPTKWYAEGEGYPLHSRAA